ncbi:ribosome-associated translation inhibitor RaiA [Myxococcota bacterium]|nr:ribosome-associated translation inhibitor RaiA [Myxococcota bacterium]
MNLEIVGKDVTPSEALRARIEQKLAKFEARLGQKLQVRTALTQEGDTFTCHVHFNAAKHAFDADGTGDDLIKATDEALNKIDRQVTKALQKGKSDKRATIDIEL